MGTALAALYCAIMISSALWMPMTFAYIAQPNAALWAGICFVLALVGVSALCIIVLLTQLRPDPLGVAWRLALLGSLCFAFQTAVLDAVIWPLLFGG